MNAIFYIIRFDVFYHLRRPITYVFALLIALQAIWYSTSLYNYSANDRIYLNSPANMYLVMASLGMVIAVVACVLAGQSLTKDLDHKATGYLYTLPMTDKAYFIGKFMATYLTVLGLALFYPLGTLLLPLLYPAQTGPVPIGQLLDGFLRVVPQNILFVTGVAFAMTVFTRRMIGAYMAMLVLVAYFLLIESNREAAFESDLLILDPFCFGVIKNSVDALSTVEKNRGYLPFADFFIINRLLWLGVVLGILVRAESQFSFQGFAGLREQVSKWPFRRTVLTPSLVLEEWNTNPRNFSEFKKGSGLKQLLWLTAWEIKGQTRQTIFRLGLVVFVLLTILYAFFYQQSGTEWALLPLTSQMTALRFPLGSCISLFLMVLTGELVYREQTTNFRLMYDTLPYQTGVTLLAKFLALTTLAALLTGCIWITGMGIQLSRGFAHEIDWTLYAHDLIVDGFFGYVQRIALALFVAVLVNNRYISHFVAISLFLGALVVQEVGLTEGVRYLYSFLPGSSQYSEMNGYGVYALAEPVYLTLWWSLAGMLITVAIWWHPRGIAEGISHRIRQSKAKFSWTYVLALAVFGTLFAGSEWQIWQHVYKAQNVAVQAEEQQQAADYERQYAYLKQRPQPRITNLDLHLDLFPSQRRLSYQATMQLINSTAQPVDTLFLNYSEHLKLTRVQLGSQPVQVLFDDTLRHVTAYTFQLKPGSMQTLTLTAQQQYKGFAQNTPQPDLTFNGTLTHECLLPTIGYEDNRELLINHDRIDHGLTKRSAALPASTDVRGLSQLQTGITGNAYPYQITVGTDADQTALAPGKRVKQWQQSGRNYVRFRSERPTPDNWRIASARYQQQRNVVQVGNQSVRVCFYYQHPYNLALFRQAITDALRQGVAIFGPYPYPELRVAEVPFYNDPVLSMPGQILLSEKQGWLTASQYHPEVVYALLTREVFKQWLVNDLPAARVQGAGFLQHGLAEYLVTQAINKRYSPNRLVKYLAYTLNEYRKGRNREDNQEMTLLQADGDAYLEQHKAALVLNSLGQVWGNDNLTRFIGQFYQAATAHRTIPFVTADEFASQLTRQLPDTLQYMTNYLNQRFWYDWQIARVNQRNDEVSVYVTGEKWNDDGFGNQQSLRLEDHVTLLMLDKNGRELARKMFLVGPDEPPVWFPQLPNATEIVIDPLGAWPDVYPANNRKRIARQ